MPRRWRAHRDPELRQLLAALSCGSGSGRAQSENGDAGVASREARNELQAGQGAARAGEPAGARHTRACGRYVDVHRCRSSDSGREHGFGVPRLPALHFVRTASGSERPSTRQKDAQMPGGYGDERLTGFASEHATESGVITRIWAAFQDAAELPVIATWAPPAAVHVRVRPPPDFRCRRPTPPGRASACRAHAISPTTGRHRIPPASTASPAISLTSPLPAAPACRGRTASQARTSHGHVLG